MNLATWADRALDRTVVLGYGTPGYHLRRRLPGWPEDGGRMDGRVVLVTGAASGIGLEAAVGFARLGASVRVLGRNQERADDAARRVREHVGPAVGGAAEADLRPVACDISSLAQLRSFTEQFLRDEARLDVLVNNAGVMPDQRTYSVDGVELTFATHVLAPWVLTEALLPVLRAAAPSRVLNVTSGGQYGQRLPAGDPESADTRYTPKKIYARTKRAQVVLTQQWAERLRDAGVHVHAVHPGWADTPGVRSWMPVFRTLTRPVIRTPAQGADTVVWLGHAPEAVRTTGLLWHDRRPRPATYALGARPDGAAARRELWDYVSRLAAAPTPPTTE
ncbi:SDR family NAD(P)-dependent oxidoreductase [Embleya sp. NPDC008237]|uniref:SDR family NAD(P)-dependent oxidoreductase n=1 Tax=Embleya sp. NPDC008237 TaxID=3363978 RepID=UPI0036E707FF